MIEVQRNNITAKKFCFITLYVKTLYDTNNHANKRSFIPEKKFQKTCLIVRSYVNQKKTLFPFIFDVKRNNLGSSTFISFECKLLIITFKIWWSFPRSSKEKETWHGKKCVLVAWLKKFISILMILFLPFWCYISLFLVNKIFIFINYWCLFCPLDDVQHEKFFV